MKSILKFLYSLLLLVILILLAGLFLPDYHSLKRETLVNAKPELVYNHINQIENWKKWAPWLISDSLAKVSSISTEGPGSTLCWESEKYGNGSLQITSCIENEVVAGTMDLGKVGKADFKISLNKKNSGTHINYEVNFSEIAYFERYFIIVMKKQLDEAYQRALTIIKTNAEELRLNRMSDPWIHTQNELKIVAILDTVKGDYLAERHSDNLNKLKSYLQRRKLEIQGDAMILYFNKKTEDYRLFASAYPIDKKTWSWKNYRYLTIDTGMVAAITHNGDYTYADPYLKLESFMQDQGLVADSFWWETYEIDPFNEADTSEWKRNIYFPVTAE